MIGDTIDESDENFFINLTDVENAVLQDAQGKGTIADNDTTLIAPEDVVATATPPTSVHISWTAAPGAASYRVYRNDGGAYTLVGSPAGTSFDDTTAAADTAYLYLVRSFAGSESTDSNTDMATTVLFTDPTLAVGTTTAKLAHFTELPHRRERRAHARVPRHDSIHRGGSNHQRHHSPPTPPRPPHRARRRAHHPRPQRADLHRSHDHRRNHDDQRRPHHGIARRREVKSVLRESRPSP